RYGAAAARAAPRRARGGARAAAVLPAAGVLRLDHDRGAHRLDGARPAARRRGHRRPGTGGADRRAGSRCGGSGARPGARGRPAVYVGAVLVVLCATLVTSASAAFTSQTRNNSNSFAAGTVNLTVNDNSNTALFSVAGIKPGDAPLSRCVTVTNAGSLPLHLNLYSGTPTGGLGSYLNLSVLPGSFGAARVS